MYIACTVSVDDTHLGTRHLHNCQQHVINNNTEMIQAAEAPALPRALILRISYVGGPSWLT